MKVCIITTSDGYGWPVTQEVEDMMVAYIYYEFIAPALDAEAELRDLYEAAERYGLGNIDITDAAWLLRCEVKDLPKDFYTIADECYENYMRWCFEKMREEEIR